MTRPLVIFGATSQARLAARYFDSDDNWKPVAFCADRDYLDVEEFCGLPVVAFEDVVELYPPDTHDLFVAIGYTDMNRLRARKFDEAKAMGYTLATYISPHCTWLSEHQPGENCFILEANTIQAGVRIGQDVTLVGCHVGHDSTIEDHVFIASHAVISGFCRIKSLSFLGVNCTLRDDITIAEATLVGAGTVIMKDTEPEEVYLAPRPTKLKSSFDLRI